MPNSAAFRVRDSGFERDDSRVPGLGTRGSGRLISDPQSRIPRLKSGVFSESRESPVAESRIPNLESREFVSDSRFPTPDPQPFWRSQNSFARRAQRPVSFVARRRVS